jgi:hypothetical protein
VTRLEGRQGSQLEARQDRPGQAPPAAALSLGGSPGGQVQGPSSGRTSKPGRVTRLEGRQGSQLEVRQDRPGQAPPAAARSLGGSPGGQAQGPPGSATAPGLPRQGLEARQDRPGQAPPAAARSLAPSPGGQDQARRPAAPRLPVHQGRASKPGRIDLDSPPGSGSKPGRFTRGSGARSIVRQGVHTRGNSVKSSVTPIRHWNCVIKISIGIAY